MALSEYIKHARHFDGLGMGDQDLEERAKKLEAALEDMSKKVAELEAKFKKIPAEKRG